MREFGIVASSATPNQIDGRVPNEILLPLQRFFRLLRQD
jgi:hypothetical protein